MFIQKMKISLKAYFKISSVVTKCEMNTHILFKSIINVKFVFSLSVFDFDDHFAI